MNYSKLLQESHFLEIRARSLAEGMKSGNFRSLYRGQGIEMSAVRDYIRGDDIRSIDWNVTARMGKPYVKVFEEHRELQIVLIVDNSRSMQIQNQDTSKYQTAAEAAALLTFASEQNECPVGTVLFDGQVNLSLPPVWGREQTMIILSKIQKNNLMENPELNLEPGSALGAAINVAGKMLKKRSLVFIFSDFRTAGYEAPLGQLSHKHDVIAIRMTDSFDSQLPAAGTIPFIDPESGEKKIFPSSSGKFIKAWKTANENRAKKLYDFCAKHGITQVNMDSTDDPLKTLSGIFSRTQKQ